MAEILCVHVHVHADKRFLLPASFYIGDKGQTQYLCKPHCETVTPNLPPVGPFQIPTLPHPHMQTQKRTISTNSTPRTNLHLCIQVKRNFRAKIRIKMEGVWANVTSIFSTPRGAYSRQWQTKDTATLQDEDSVSGVGCHEALSRVSILMLGCRQD